MAEKETSRPQHAGRIKDARGKPVALLDPYSLHLLRRHDVIEADPLREIAEELGPGVRKRRRLMYQVGFVSGLYAVSCAVFLRAIKGTLLRFAGIGDPLLLLLFVIVFGGLYLYLRSTRRTRLGRVRGIMLKHLRCPHCGYDLRLLPTDPEDGATICPECGCAWLLAEGT